MNKSCVTNEQRYFNIFDQIYVGPNTPCCDVRYISYISNGYWLSTNGYIFHRCDQTPSKCTHENKKDENNAQYIYPNKYCPDFSNGDVFTVDVNVKDNSLSFWRNNENLDVA